MWTDECQKAFELLKDELTKAPVSDTLNSNVPFSVQTDASEVRLGAVLTQEVDGEEKVIACASRLLRGGERSYSVSEGSRKMAS